MIKTRYEDYEIVKKYQYIKNNHLNVDFTIDYYYIVYKNKEYYKIYNNLASFEDVVNILKAS